MTRRITITREIGIDMGHRVPNHASKCSNLHGHRYKVEVTVTGPIIPDGAEEGMVMDFGFVKEAMMEQIDAPCDHGTCLWIEDPTLLHILGPNAGAGRKIVATNGFFETTWVWGKLYILDRVPTAENLAAHWARRVDEAIAGMMYGSLAARPRVIAVTVWETPNCRAVWESTL